MSLSIGIVGLPNVGKSTLFNALLKKQVALAANYPFATIEPNIGVAEVPDERLPALAKIVNTQTIKPALVKFIDIAGLVEGASQGEGLGNKFLSHIRETDAICHVLRVFDDENVAREGSVDPIKDLTTIRTELQIADLETLEKQRQPKGVKAKEQPKRWELILEFKQRLNGGQNVLPSQWLSMSQKELTPQQKEAIALAKELNLLTFKPELFVLNVDESKLKRAEEIRQQYVELLSNSQHQVELGQIVAISAKIESELASLSAKDQLLYMQDLGIEQSGLERLALVAYETLGLQSFLTAGELEARAWTIKKGSTAVQAAGVIHTDFMQKFIKARVVSHADFVKYNGWTGCKEIGKLRIEGRDYIMKEDDVVEFMIGT
jgi:hypothetical protein